MYIISKFRDYYDVGMRMGIDKTIVYQRDPIVVKAGFMSINVGKYNEWRKSILAFCGEFYPFVYQTANSEILRIIWDADEAVKVLPKSKYKYYWEDSIDTEIGIRRFFDKKYPEMKKLFYEHKTPVFGFIPPSSSSYRHPTDKLYKALQINPNLKEIEFYKVKDPITAFQNIHMYISGVLGVPEKKSKPITDKIMAASKGHDGEFSFKKPPGSKRGKPRWR